MIRSGALWCAKWSDMNDPMEGFYYFDRRDARSERKIQAREIKMNKHRNYICCLSGDYAIPTQWAYYAENYSGVALEYELGELEGQEVAKIGRVKYVSSGEAFQLDHFDEAMSAAESILMRKLIFFQSKAEVMAAARLKKEMRPKGVARSIFAELAAKQGAYIVFSTDDPSKSAHDERITAMTEVLVDVAGSDAVLLDFYGADKIARWANSHRGVAIWLLGELGRPLGGWRPYGDWSAPGAHAQVYLFDDTARVEIDGVTMSIRDGLIAMRKLLIAPGGAVRLIGPSGMGKTRLAEALFDDRFDPATALVSSLAIYGDAGLELAVGPALVAEQLAAASIPAIIVVDNCLNRTHGQVAEIVSQNASRASLITIDHDLSGEKPAGTLIRLLGNSEDILAGLLSQRFPNLSDAERRHLAQFSGGNARIALKVAEAGAVGIDLSKLNDNELLDRLFQGGRQALDPAARACAEAASLVHAFYVRKGDGHEAEHAVLADIAEVSTETFYRLIATFLEWGVVQQRGPQRAVMPQPLANMIVAQHIRRSDPERLVAKFLTGPERLLASFARRIGQLHDEPVAVEIAKLLFGDSGAFGAPGRLHGPLHYGFIKAAPAAPEAALSALERSLVGPDRAALLAANEERKQLTQLLVHFAHDASLFARSAEILIAFTLEDGDVRDELRARSHLLERFWPILSYTLANQEQRMTVIDRMLEDPNPRVRALGVEALDHVLDSGHFSSSLNLEFGARARWTEWRPYNGAGYPAWFNAAYDRLIATSTAGGEGAERAREIVADHFREHLNANIPDKNVLALQAVKGTGYWEKGWRAISDALHFFQRRRPSDHPQETEALKTLVALEQEFRPKTVDDHFDTFVLGEPWRHWHPSGRQKASVRNVRRLAQAVGRAIMRQGFDPAPYLDRAAYAKGAHSVWAFMSGLASAAADLETLWDAAYMRFAADPMRAVPGLLGGILEGARRKDRAFVDAKLDLAVKDPLLIKHLVTFQNAVPLDADAMGRFSQVLREGTISVERFTQLMMGSVTKPLPAAALTGFLRELMNVDDGISPGVQILHMRIFGDRTDQVAIDPALVGLGREVLADSRVYGLDDRHNDHGLVEIAEAVFAAGGAEPVARAICVATRERAGNDYFSDHEFGELARLVMRRFPRVVLEEIVGKSSNDYLIECYLGDRSDDDDTGQTEAEIAQEAVLAWVAEDPQARAVKIAHVVRYTVNDSQTDMKAWSPIALAIIALAPDPAAVLRAFENRFFTGAGWGPVSLRFVRRRPLVEAMIGHDDPRVQLWARRASENMEESIKRWDERNRESDSRFE